MTSAPGAGAAAPAVPRAPAAAAALFAERLALARAYAERLAGDGVTRGLLGPREVPRLWDRHLLNCAVLTDLVPRQARVVDVGSGAGLPGLAMAIRRADLQVQLVEPLQRRVDFLTEIVDALDLGQSVQVIRGRAEDPQVGRIAGNSDWVVARAVAPLDRLVKWCLPLLAPGGRLLALKGVRAADEVAEHGNALQRLGVGEVELQTLGSQWGLDPTRVVVVQRSTARRPMGREGQMFSRETDDD